MFNTAKRFATLCRENVFLHTLIDAVGFAIVCGIIGLLFVGFHG